MKKFLLSLSTALLVICMVCSLSTTIYADTVETVLPDGITEESFGENTVYDGENYYATMVQALEGIHLTGKNVLYCKPGADIGAMTHGHVCSTLTVYGNGAYISGGEQDFEVDMYKYCHNEANACEGIVADMTLTVNALNCSGAWGNRYSTHTVNLIFNNCLDMSRIYISGTAGDNNVALNNCSFTSNATSDCKVYTNANGTVALNGCDFSNVSVPVNLNHKVAGTQTITISDCTFTNCGTDEYDYSAPIRVLSSVDGAVSALTVSNTSFTGTVANSLGQNADILLDYGVGNTEASISGTSANLSLEKVNNVATDSVVDASENVTAKSYDIVASVNGVEFKSLQAAIDAAAEGAEIDIVDNFALTAQNVKSLVSMVYNRDFYCGVYVPDDKAITLDLNGYTVSYVDTYGDFDNVMILNLGNLTINDSVGDGKLTYKAVADASQYAKFYSAIFNCGTLTVNAGTIENTCETDYDVTNAVDNHSRLSHEYENDCILVVNGGTLTGSEYYSIRQYTHFFEGVKNRVTINGGTLNNGIYMQHGDSWYYADPSANRLNVDCQLVINDGIFNVTYEGACSVVSRSHNPDNNAWHVEINGGTFAGPINLRMQRGVFYTNGVSGATTPAEEVGTRNAEWLEANGGFIYGGTFADIGSTDDVTANLASFLVEGYVLEENNGAYGVAIDPEQDVFEASINGKGYTTLQAAIDAAEDGDTVTIFEGTYSAAPILYGQSEVGAYADNLTIVGSGNVTLLIDDADVAYNHPSARQYYVAGSWSDALTSIAFENINFDLVNNDTAERVDELYVYATNVSFKNCSFDDISVSPSKEGTAIFEGCKFSNITGRSSIHYSKASELTVTGCDFQNCSSGIHLVPTELDALTVTGNTFIGVDSDSIALTFGSEGGDYSESTITVTGNNAAGQAMLRNLNLTLNVSDVQEITDPDLNIFGTAYSYNSKVYVAAIGEIGYETITEAIAAVTTEGEIVTLLSDLVLTTTINIDNGISFTLNGNGNKITNNGATNTALMIGNTGHTDDATDADPTYTISNVVFDGWTTAHVVRVQGVNAVIDGCTFQNTTQTSGCAIVSFTYANGTVKNSKFLNNIALEGIDFNSYSTKDTSGSVTLTVENCDFISNNFTAIGALYYHRGAEATVTGCEFTDNTCALAPVFMGLDGEGAAVSNSTFTNNTGSKSNAIVAEGGCSISGVDEASINAVAKIGNVYYGFLEDALEAVKDIEEDVTIQLLPGEIEEGDIQFPSTLTNVTILGAENKGTTILNSGFRSADGNSLNYDGITIDGIVFDNSYILFTGWRTNGVYYGNWTITNCEFKNITSENHAVGFNLASSLSGDADEAMENFTFTNNVINGVESNAKSGLVINALKGNITITGNDIQNVNWNAVQAINIDEDSTVIIEDNVLASGAEEGIINLYNYNGESLSVTENQILVNDGQYGIGYLATADISGNYWGEGKTPAVYSDGTNSQTYISYYESVSEDGTLADIVYTHVAEIGDKKYPSIAAALNDVQEGETIQLVPGTFEEGTIKLPATLKNVTILGAEDKATTLKNTTIMAADGNSISYEGLTFDGIVFDNSDILITGWRASAEISDLTITNCEFKNIARDPEDDNTKNRAAVHINVDTATEAVDGFTFTNNVIDGVSGDQPSGVYLQATGEIVFDGNVISNVAFRPMIVHVADTDGNEDTVTITNNTFSGSPVGRLQALGTGSGTDNVELTVNENIFSDITDSQQICFWSFNEETTTNDFTDNYYSVDIAANPNKIYYNSAAGDVEDLDEFNVYPLYTRLNEDGTIDRTSSIDAPVAYVDGVYYNTIEAAAEANPDETVTVDLADDIVVSTELDLITEGVILNQNGKIITLTGEGVIKSSTPLDVTPDFDHALITEGNETDGYTYTVTTTKYTATIHNASGSGMYLQDTVIEITADAPAQGMRFDRWEVVSGGIYVKNIYASTTTFTMPANDVEITALYKLDSTGSLGGGAVIRTVGVIASASEGGTITPSGLTQVNIGSDIVYIITPNAGYEIADVTVDGVSVGVVSEYAFRSVRDSHTISATFAKIEVAPESPFTDVSADDWYFEDVKFVYENELMIGTDLEHMLFSPDMTVNRAMVVTILWRLEGSPIVDSDVDFTDVVADEWYSDAISWASANGIVLGYGNDKFGPEDAVTREQVVAILHRYAIYKGESDAVAPMIPAYEYNVWFENDIIWADLGGLLDGFGVDMEDMTKEADRAEIAAILRRFCQE